MPEQPAYRSPLPAWSKHENAPRVTCPICHFESSEGYPESHTSDCMAAETRRLQACGRFHTDSGSAPGCSHANAPCCPQVARSGVCYCKEDDRG